MIERLLVLDTETTGKCPETARLASLAMILVDPPDCECILCRNFNRHEHEYHYFVKPDGWTMPAEATAIHGLTQEFLEANGQPLAFVLKEFRQLVAGRRIVAHNAQYDLTVLRTEYYRMVDAVLDESTAFCTMREATAHCKLPSVSWARGPSYKWPRLEEAAAHFGIEVTDAHSALGDARTCLAVYRKLREREKVTA